MLVGCILSFPEWGNRWCSMWCCTCMNIVLQQVPLLSASVGDVRWYLEAERQFQSQRLVLYCYWPPIAAHSTYIKQFIHWHIIIMYVLGVYDCKKNSPCTAANRALGKYYFTYVDLSKYIQCDAFGRCMVRPCARGTFFKASISTCVHTWRYWVHHRRSMMI